MFKHALLAAAAVLTISSPVHADETPASNNFSTGEVPFSYGTNAADMKTCADVTNLFSSADEGEILARLRFFHSNSCDVNALFTTDKQEGACLFNSAMLNEDPADEHLQLVDKIFNCGRFKGEAA